MTLRHVTDLPIRGLEAVFCPPGIPLANKGAAVPTTSIALAGAPGSGKTTLAVALAHAIARDMGGVALYVSTELVSTELGHKVEFLGLAKTQVLRRESAVAARAGDLLTLHLALADPDGRESSVGSRALGAALRDIQRARAGQLPIRCVVIDAFPLTDGGVDAGESREDVVGAMQVVESAGSSVIMVDENQSLRDYVPFVADIVLDLGVEQAGVTGALTRRVTCRKSRYTRSLPGPHDTGVESGLPAVWPDPLRVLHESGSAARWQIPRPPSFFMPVGTDAVATWVNRGFVLVSTYDAKPASPICRLLDVTPGLTDLNVKCGPVTSVLARGVPVAHVPDWEGPFSLGWTLIRKCHELGANLVVLHDLEGLLDTPQATRALLHVLQALRLARIGVCVHGAKTGLAPLAPLADFVWGGAFPDVRIGPTAPHRRAGDWLAVETWPARADIRTPKDRRAHGAQEKRFARFQRAAYAGDVEGAKSALESMVLPPTAEGRVGRSRRAVGLHLLGATAAAWQSLFPRPASELAAVSDAWAMALMGWRRDAADRVTLICSKSKESVGGLSALWAALVLTFTASDAALDGLVTEAEREPALVPFVVRGLAAKQRWSDVAAVAAEAVARCSLPTYMTRRIEADARLEIDDRDARTDAERRLRELTQDPDVTAIHAADIRYNLGVVAASDGRLGEATTCWRKALELNPLLDCARERLGPGEAEREQAG